MIHRDREYGKACHLHTTRREKTKGTAIIGEIYLNRSERRRRKRSKRRRRRRESPARPRRG